MTIIIGAVLKDSVMFVSDTLRAIINQDGVPAGAEAGHLQKVKQLNKYALIGTAGLGDLNDATVSTIRAILGHQVNPTKEALLSTIQNVYRNHQQEFTRQNPDVYNKMAALIGGVNPPDNLPYLNYYHSDNDFQPEVVPSIKIIGSTRERQRLEETVVPAFMREQGHQFGIYASFFAKAIREVAEGSQFVGKQVYGVNISKDGALLSCFIEADGTSVDPRTHNFV